MVNITTTSRLMATLGAVLTIGALIGMGTAAYARVRADITEPIIKTTTYVIRMIDYAQEYKSDADKLKRTIDALQDSLQDKKNKKVEKAIDDLKRQWRYKLRKLDNAIQSKEIMLVHMERGSLLEQI